MSFMVLLYAAVGVASAAAADGCSSHQIACQTERYVICASLEQCESLGGYEARAPALPRGRVLLAKREAPQKVPRSAFR